MVVRQGWARKASRYGLRDDFWVDERRDPVRATRAAARPLAEATARISRLEGMEGHARSADIRLAKFFPDEVFDLRAPAISG